MVRALLVPASLILLLPATSRAPVEGEPRGTALRQAARQGDVVRLRHLLRAGVDPDASDAHGRTAMVAAAAAGQVTVLKELLKAGADPDLRDREWGNALDAAARHDHEEVGRLLREAGARGSGKSPGSTVCVRPWQGEGFCGRVEAVRGHQYQVRLGWVVGCAEGCEAWPECSAGRAVGGTAKGALTVGDEVWLRGECLTDVGVVPGR